MANNDGNGVNNMIPIGPITAYAIAVEKFGYKGTMEDWYNDHFGQASDEMRTLEENVRAYAEAGLTYKNEAKESEASARQSAITALGASSDATQSANLAHISEQNAANSEANALTAANCVKTAQDNTAELKSETQGIRDNAVEAKQIIEQKISDFETKYDELREEYLNEETGVFAQLENTRNTYGDDLLNKRNEYDKSLRDAADELIEEMQKEETYQKIEDLKENKADGLALENGVLTLKSGENVLGNIKLENTIAESAEGEFITLNDSAQSYLGGLKVYGKSTQEKTTGAQLFDVHARTNTNTYITIDDDEYAHFEYDATDMTREYFAGIYVPVSQLIKPNTQYLAVIEVKEMKDVKIEVVSDYELNMKSQFQTTFALKEDINNETRVKIVTTREDFAESTNMLRTVLSISPGNIGKAVFRISLIEDTTINADTFVYEKFTGGLPSPNYLYPQEIKNVGDKGNINLNVLGKNLYDSEDYMSSVSSTTGFAVAPDKLKKFILSLPIGGTYTCTYKVVGGTTAGTLKGKISFVQFGGNIILNGVNTFTLTKELKESVGRINIYGNIGTDILFTDFMVTVGTDFLPYEPYKKQILNIATPNDLRAIPVDSGGNYTDENGQNWIADYIDLERGVHVQSITQKTLNSQDVLYIDATNASFNIINATLVEKYDSDNYVARTINGICNRFREKTSGENLNVFSIKTVASVGWGGAARILLYVSKDIDTVDKAKEFLRANETIVWFPLKNPIETDLTAEEIEAYRALHTNYPTTNIANDENAHMSVIYGADTKAYIDKKFNELQSTLANTQAQIL